MIDKEIQRDIEKWSDDRLKLWFKDTMTRYQMMDASQQEAYANTTATMLAAASLVMACTGADPAKCGEIFEGMVKSVNGEIKRHDRVQGKGDSKLRRRKGEED